MSQKLFKTLTRLIVFILTLLTAQLLSALAGDYLATFKHRFTPLSYTLLAMAVAVIIFYPAFQILNQIIEAITKVLIKNGKDLAGPFIGLLIAAFFMFFVLTLAYLDYWFGINVIKITLDGRLRTLF